jgi:hypothetical protein
MSSMRISARLDTPPLGCQQELATKVFSGVLTCKNPEDSYLASEKAILCVLLYLFIRHDKRY